MRALFYVLAYVVAIAVTGCGGTVTVRPPIVEPLIDPEPVSVAVYYSDDLRNHQCTGSKGYIAYSWNFALGPPSVAMLDKLIAAMFQEVETVNTGPADYSRYGQKNLVELRLSKFDGCDASWPILGTTSIEVAYEATIWSGESRQIARWVGRGKAGPGDDLERYLVHSFEFELSHLAALTSVAMRKAGADFVVNFKNDPEIREWLED